MTTKIKIPSLLSLRLVCTTHYYEYCIYFYQCIKDRKLKRGTAEHKAAVRMYRRLLSLHQKQLRERRKALSVYLIIKAYLQEKKYFTPADLNHIAALCDYKHIKTLHSNIKILQSLSLLEYRKDKAFVAGWDDLCRVFKIDAKFIRNKYVKLEPGKKIEDILLCLAMAEKEQQCEIAANYKLNKVPELKQMVKGISGRDSLAAVNEMQREVFLSPQLAVALNLDTYLLFEVCRGDTALSYRLWSCLLGYKGLGSMACLKRKMIKQGFIAVFKRRQIIDDGLKTTRKSRSGCLGTVVYNRTTQQTEFIQPDKIRYLSLNLAA